MKSAASPRRPRVGITLGDPRGIGPEVVAAALADPQVAALADFILIGPEGYRGLRVTEGIGKWEAAGDAALAGHLAGLAIERGTELALAGAIDALVTAPIDKSAFHAGGWNFPGHTEMLRELARVPAVAMMMAAEETRLGAPLRVVLATTHVALRHVPDLLDPALLVEQILLTRNGLRDWWGFQEPRLALGALNPHASDGGLFGDEEARIFEPALREVRSLGIVAQGPIPADTLFARCLAGEFDAVIAPYHDVGIAPFKTVSFGSGVNVTLGLPFPRTSPDHGTALDIAGRGIANPSSMVAAIHLAIRLAGRFDTPPDDS